jgi:hypothetical protein
MQTLRQSVTDEDGGIEMEQGRRQAYWSAMHAGDISTLTHLLVQDGPPVSYSPAASVFAAAAKAGKQEVVDAFLRAGTNPDVFGDVGETALMASAQAASGDVILRRLLDAGADVRVTDSNGWSALFFAARAHEVENATVLVEAGADVDAVDAEGHSVVDAARLRSFSVPFLRGGGAYRSSAGTPIVAYLQRIRSAPTCRPPPN